VLLAFCVVEEAAAIARVTQLVMNSADESPRIVTNKGSRTAPSYNLQK